MKEKSGLVLPYGKAERKKKREMVWNIHTVLFYLAPVHSRTGVDFLFKITVSPFNSKVNALRIFKNLSKICCHLIS